MKTKAASITVSFALALLALPAASRADVTSSDGQGATAQTSDRSYSAVSNIMKTKHDTAKNSISNVR